MRTISQRELRNGSAAVMDAVERGESFRISRNGVDVAELRPVSPHRRPSVAALLDRRRTQPRVDSRQFRADLDAFDPDRLPEG